MKTHMSQAEFQKLYDRREVEWRTEPNGQLADPCTTAIYTADGRGWLWNIQTQEFDLTTYRGMAEAVVYEPMPAK